jgi:FkbM family methyltransferase
VGNRPSLVRRSIRRFLPHQLAQVKTAIAGYASLTNPTDWSRGTRSNSLSDAIMRKVVFNNSNCIDIGASDGEILAMMVRRAPNGQMYAFEPLADKASALRQRYAKNPLVHVVEACASDVAGKTNFFEVTDNSGYSGMRVTDAARAISARTQSTEIPTVTLDEVLPTDLPVSLIKIDVEGAEHLVLTGAAKLIEKNKPVILFEHTVHSTTYGETTAQIFEQLTSAGLIINPLEYALDHRSPLGLRDFEMFHEREYADYFVAYTPGKF